MYIIYVHSCVISGKHYVGVTSASIEDRWRDHLRNVKKGDDTRFYRAIRRYGEDPWLHEILERNIETKEEAYKAEEYWVEAMEAYDFDIGYNSRPGGLGGWEHINNDPALKAKRSRLTTGEKNGRAKLTADDVRMIRKLYAEGIVQTELARRFGVTQYVISAIHRGILWRSVPHV